MAAGLAAGFASPAAADAFDSTWCQVDAGEFRLVTDRPRNEAEALVRHLRTFRPVAEHYLPGKPKARDPALAIIVFEHQRDFRRAMANSEMTAFMQPSFAENLMVVGPGVRNHSEHESLFHEYVHYLLRTRIGINIPPWLDEGLASMLSSARMEPGRVVVGALPAGDLEETIRQARLSLRRVLEAEDVWDWHPRPRLGFYAWSWVLSHRLMLGQEARRDDLRPALAAFLAERQPSLPAALDASPALLERRLKRYLDRHPPTVTHPAEDALESTGAYHCLDEADKVRELSLAIVQHNPELAARHLRIQLDAHEERADLWRALSLAEEIADDREGSLDAARRAIDLAPHDVTGAVRLASALVMGCILEVSEKCRARWQEAVPLLRQSLRRDPTRQDAIFILGLAYLYSGRAGDALNYLRIAHQRQPWAPHVNFYLGESYRIIGDARAREHLTRARQWSPTELWRRMAEAGLERLSNQRAPDR